MQIKTWIKYTEGYLPTPRCRKLRYKECEEFVALELKEVSLQELLPVIQIGAENTIIYQYNDKLYTKATARGISGFNIENPLENLKYCHENCSSFFGFNESDSKEAMINKAKRALSRYLVVEGELYAITQEPMYNYTVFGLGNNHGGTGLFIVNGYNCNLSNRSYFKADEREEAIAETLKVAADRGDTESLDRIKNIAEIKLLNGYTCKRDPKKEHVC